MSDLDYVTRYFGVTPTTERDVEFATEQAIYQCRRGGGRSMSLVDKELTTNSCMLCEGMAAKLGIVQAENERLWKMLEQSLPIMSRALNTAILWNTEAVITECDSVVASYKDLLEKSYSKAAKTHDV